MKRKVVCLFCDSKIWKKSAKSHDCLEKRAAERQVGARLATYDGVQYAVENEAAPHRDERKNTMISEQEAVETLTNYMQEEVRAFAEQGIRGVKEDDLLYAAWLRHQIDVNTAMLRLVRCGKVTVCELNREDMEATTLVRS